MPAGAVQRSRNGTVPADSARAPARRDPPNQSGADGCLDPDSLALILIALTALEAPA